MCLKLSSHLCACLTSYPNTRAAFRFTSRFDGEWGEFKLWCTVAQRAIEDSGVPADEVEEKVEKHRRCARSLIYMI